MPKSKAVRTYEALRDAMADVKAGKGSEGILFGSLKYADGIDCLVAIPGARPTGDPDRPYDIPEDMGMIAYGLNAPEGDLDYYERCVVCDVPKDLSGLTVLSGVGVGEFADGDRVVVGRELLHVTALAETVGWKFDQFIPACTGHELTRERDLAGVLSAMETRWYSFTAPDASAPTVCEVPPADALRESMWLAYETETYANFLDATGEGQPIPDTFWREYAADKQVSGADIPGCGNIEEWKRKLGLRIRWAESAKHDLENWSVMYPDGRPDDGDVTGRYGPEPETAMWMAGRMADVLIDPAKYGSASTRKRTVARFAGLLENGRADECLAKLDGWLQNAYVMQDKVMCSPHPEDFTMTLYYDPHASVSVANQVWGMQRFHEEVPDWTLAAYMADMVDSGAAAAHYYVRGEDSFALQVFDSELRQLGGMGLEAMADCRREECELLESENGSGPVIARIGDMEFRTRDGLGNYLIAESQVEGLTPGACGKNVNVISDDPRVAYMAQACSDLKFGKATPEFDSWKAHDGARKARGTTRSVSEQLAAQQARCVRLNVPEQAADPTAGLDLGE